MCSRVCVMVLWAFLAHQCMVLNIFLLCMCPFLKQFMQRLSACKQVIYFLFLKQGKWTDTSF